MPVSSSGHLILFQRIFGLPEDILLFTILLHVATLLAVVIVFRKTIWNLIKNPFNKMNYCLVLSTIITCVFVLLFREVMESAFNYRVLPITFMLTAIILFGVTMLDDKNNKNPRPESAQNNDTVTPFTKGGISYPSAMAVGFTQFLAVIPGLSRSGTTISTLMATGVKRETAAEYSFLMSIPIIIASLVFEVINSGGAPMDVQPLPLTIAFIAAFVSGIFAIKFMLKIIKNVKLWWFSIYLVLLSIVTLFVL